MCRRAALLAIAVCLSSWATIGFLGHITQGLPDTNADAGHPSGWIENRGLGDGSPPYVPDAVVPLGGHFVPPHNDVGLDVDGDHLYDFLVVQANVSIDSPDNYTVYGTLYQNNTTLYLSNLTSVYLEPGDWTVSIFFDGAAINDSGVDGPYTVLLNLFEVREPLDTNYYTTHFYRHTDFGSAPARFAPPHSDAGVDTDGDGLFNLLNVTANLTVKIAGQYYINAVLFGSNFTLSLFWSGIRSLDVGPRSVVLSFPGDALNASGIDGPYSVSMGLFTYPTYHLVDHGTHVTKAYNHTDFEEPRVLASSYAPTTPTIDGTIGADEWTRAHVEDLSTIPGNRVAAFLLVMNDDNFLYVAYDAVGDSTADPHDVAAIAFDTGDDGQATIGREDEFVLGGLAPSNLSAHYVYGGQGAWTIHDSPFNPDLPGQNGLAGKWGFGPSPNENSPHRIYELKIPLSLLGVGPADTVGFFAGSHLRIPSGAPMPGGVFDEKTGEWSSWPDRSVFPLPLDAYGDLILASKGGDSIPPMITITSPAADAVVQADTVTVTWNASDVGSGLDRFEVRVDGTLVGTVRPPDMAFTVTGLGDGRHTINVTAYDAVGNARSDDVRVTVDTLPPSLSLISPVDRGAIRSRRLVVQWTATDAGTGISGYKIQLDSGDVANLPALQTTYAFDGLKEGQHSVTLTALDGLGRSKTDSASFTVDVTPPTLTIDAPQGGYLGVSTVAVSWTAADAGSGLAGIQVALDSGPAVNLEGTARNHTFSSVPDGLHEIRVTAIDAAGNRNEATVDVTVDTAPPDVSITSPTPGAIVHSSDVTIVFTRDDPSGIDRIEISVDGSPPVSVLSGATSHVLTGLTEGDHHIELTVYDRAGNFRTATTTFRVDTSFVSPSGPLGYGGIGILAALAIGFTFAAVAIVRRRRGARPPQPPL